MSTLGKVLLVVNLLAAGGLVYLTAQDYAKRQQLNSTAVQFRLLVDGVPVEAGGEIDGDDVPLKMALAPGVRIDAVDKKVLDKYFSATGGTAVRSQVEEVKAQKDKVINAASAMGNNTEKLGFLCGALAANGSLTPGVLMRLADSHDERLAIRALALTKDPAKMTAAYDEAVRRLNRKFDAVLTAPNPQAAGAEATKLEGLKAKAANKDAESVKELADLESEGLPAVSRDDGDRRIRIARLLALSIPVTQENAAAQKRVMHVCGLKVYAAAIADQSARLQEMTLRSLRDVELDQQQFSDEYEQLKRLAQELDQILYQQQRVVTGLKAQAVKDDEAVNIRNNQLAALKSDLGKVTDKVAELLRDQTKVEADLLKVQQDVGRTLNGNFGLEDKLIKAEQGKK